MAFFDLLNRETTVVIGGRRVVCRPPTIQTVLAVLGLYRDELRVFLESPMAAAAPDDIQAALEVLFLADSRRARIVLSTCCRCDDGQELPLFEDLAPLAVAVLSICRPQKIASRLDVDPLRRPAEDGPDDSAGADGGESVDPLARAVVDTGLWFRLSPLEVAEWPYEAFCAVREVLNEMAPP